MPEKPRKFESRGSALWYWTPFKKLRSFLARRGAHVAAIWFCVGLCVFGSRWLPGCSGRDNRGELTNKILSFADSALIEILFLGVLVMLGIHAIVWRNKRTLGPAGAKWGQSWITSALDEVSSAATHFVAITLLCLCFTQSAPVGWSTVASLLFLLITAVFCFDADGNDENYRRPSDEEYRATIENPGNGDTVDQMILQVRGAIRFSPPDGFKLWLVRRWADRIGEYHPVKMVEYPDQRRDDGFVSWVAPRVFIGGQQGDDRHLEAWLVGPEGQAIMDAWQKGHDAFQKLRSKVPGGVRQEHLYPGLVETTNDMISCGSILLHCSGVGGGW